MKKQFLLLCTFALVVLSACNKAGERGETGPQGPQGLPGKDLVAEPLFSFDTTGNGVKVMKIASGTFKKNAKTVTTIVADFKKFIETGAANQLATNQSISLEEEDKALKLNVKELTTTVADDAIGVIVPFKGEGIKAGATITLSIVGNNVTDNTNTDKTVVGMGFATQVIGDGFVDGDIEGFNSIVLGVDKNIPLSSITVPVARKDIKQLFFQITAEEASKKLFEAGSSQVDIAISVKDGQHIDTKHIILKGVAAS